MGMDGAMPDGDGSDAAAIAAAVCELQAGKLIGLPTETVYGLAADAGNGAAVACIFALKGRPASHPLIVHVADALAVPYFAADVPPFAQRLMAAFWPGPLTVIVPRRQGVAVAAASGQNAIGLRCPAHPVARALLTACARAGLHGLAAPSANRFGRVSPTAAAHVRAEFGDGLLVLDGGACSIGIESTIIDCTRGAPVLLRPGLLTRAQIEAACGERLRSPDEPGAPSGSNVSSALAQPAPRASGTLAAHYAPRAKVRLMDAEALQAAFAQLSDDARAATALYARTLPRSGQAGPLRRRMPDDAAAAAHELFAALREFDTRGAAQIWIETPPDTPEWEGIADRLRRAAQAA